MEIYGMMEMIAFARLVNSVELTLQLHAVLNYEQGGCFLKELAGTWEPRSSRLEYLQLLDSRSMIDD